MGISWLQSMLKALEVPCLLLPVPCHLTGRLPGPHRAAASPRGTVATDVAPGCSGVPVDDSWWAK